MLRSIFLRYLCSNWFLINTFNIDCTMEQMKMIDPNYGVTWMFMPDDQGTPHIIDLTEPDSKSRAILAVADDVNFYYYRKDSAKSPQKFQLKNDDLELKKTYDPAFPTKFVIHGWMSSQESDSCQHIKDAYLLENDMNVITVDWKPIAADPTYFRAAAATRNVGAHVAELIDKMIKERGAKLDDIHIIGHSLGAHTSGFAGSFVSAGKVSRVTGLDPARPGFRDQQPEKLLDTTDAQFVDVIHTCSGLLGSDLNLGHVDFWPNGGISKQPGCGTFSDFVGACSHGRSFEYFAESVYNPEGFMAYPCNSTEDFNNGKCTENPIPMGDPVPRDARGNYFLQTGDDALYGRSLKPTRK